MGWAQRSRRHLRENTRCYLCGQLIEGGQTWNRDHVPPARIFASAIRREFSPNLAWLPTHVACNSSFRPDEEYFIASFAGHVGTRTADAVMKDLGNAATKGHGVGLIKEVISRFGTIVGPKGEVLYSFDKARVDRCLWKIVRGLYCLDLNAILPEQFIGDIYLVSPRDVPGDLQRIGWFPAVRDTGPMGRYGEVFDYKWLGWKDGEIRGHAVAMLFWDGLIAATLFHDPTCACARCGTRPTGPSTTGIAANEVHR